MLKFSPSFCVKALGLLMAGWLLSSQVSPVAAQSPSPVVSPMPASAAEQMVASGSGFNAITSPNGPHFFSGDTVVIDRDLHGDVYVAGGNVRVESRIDGDLLVGAGQVVIDGEVTEDVRVGTGSLVLNGHVGDDMSIGAGSVRLAPGSQVAGSVVIGAGDVNLYGTIGENAWIGSGHTLVAGTIGGDLKLHGDQATFMPEAVIVGSLSTVLGTQPQIPESVVISGQRDLKVVDHQDRNQAETALAAGAVAGASIGWFIVWLLMGLVAGFVFLLLLPGVTRGVAQNVLQSPLAALGWGLVHLVLTPIAAILLMITIIGLPIGLILMFLWVMSLIIGGWIAAFALGQKLLGGPAGFAKSLVQLALGLLILGLIGLIPVIGWLIKFVALLMGLGAVILWLRGARNPEVVEPEVVTVAEEPLVVSEPVRTRRTSKAKVSKAKPKTAPRKSRRS